MAPGPGAVRGLAARSWWTLFAGAAVLTLLFGVFMEAGWAGETLVLWVGDLVQVVAPAIAAGAALWRARLSAGRTRAAWTWLAVAAASWMLGQAIWSVFELGLGDELPFPSLADVFYLALVPAAAVGVLWLTSGGGTRLSGARATLDGMVIAGSLLFMSWATVLGPAYRDTESSRFEWAVLLAYPLGDIVIATIGLVALAQVRGRRRVPVLLVSLAMLALALADTGFAYLVQEGAYDTGSWIDAGWVGGFLLLAMAALWPAPPDFETEPRDVLTTGQMLLPYVPLAAAAGTALGLATGDERLDWVLVVLGALLALLVLVRQLITLLENRRLTRDLEQVVAELRIREGELAHEATHDRLTGLANRRLFADRVAAAIARGEGGAVLLCDLDGFKAVNDTFGHLAGDQVLEIAARRMVGAVRHQDTVARFGGDEFAVLLAGVTDLPVAEETAARLVRDVAGPMTLDGFDDVRVGISIGVHVAAGAGRDRPSDPDELDELLRRADAALYAAKAAGKNGYRVFEPAMLSPSPVLTPSSE